MSDAKFRIDEAIRAVDALESILDEEAIMTEDIYQRLGVIQEELSLIEDYIENAT